MWATTCFLLLAGFAAGANASFRFPKPILASGSAAKYETKFFDSFINNFDPTGGKTFPVKYLINKDTFKDNGPLFFYTGNEGTVETFVDNTGIMFDLAPSFNALIVFCEHRYYGNKSSMPFDDESFKSLDNVKYLTIEQTLADYVTLIKKLRMEYKFSKVIAFGGSYGGMLSAWFRQKYPEIVDGAWAASAPVAYFRGNPKVPMGGFDQTVTNTMTRFGCNKAAVIASLGMLDNADSDYLDYLNQVFKPAPESKIQTKDDIPYLKAYIREGFEYMAMTCYPYKANFLKQLDAWPMRQACSLLGDIPNDKKAAAVALKKAVDAYFTGSDPPCFKPGCPDQGTTNLGDLYGWAWQSCTQIAIDICAQGPDNDVFWRDCTDKEGKSDPPFETYFAAGCRDLNDPKAIPGYDVKFIKYDFIKENYGFTLPGATKLILTQGVLDPWSVGGISLEPAEALDREIYIYKIDGAAHHLDLRVPNSCDPETVTNVRFQIYNILKCWTGQEGGKYCDQPASLSWNLPTWSGPPSNQEECTQLDFKYPWGQNFPGQGQKSTGSTQAPPKTTDSSDASRYAIATSFLLTTLLSALFYSF